MGNKYQLGSELEMSVFGILTPMSYFFGNSVPPIKQSQCLESVFCLVRLVHIFLFVNFAVNDVKFIHVLVERTLNEEIYSPTGSDIFILFYSWLTFTNAWSLVKLIQFNKTNFLKILVSHWDHPHRSPVFSWMNVSAFLIIGGSIVPVIFQTFYNQNEEFYWEKTIKNLKRFYKNIPGFLIEQYVFRISMLIAEEFDAWKSDLNVLVCPQKRIGISVICPLDSSHSTRGESKLTAQAFKEIRFKYQRLLQDVEDLMSLFQVDLFFHTLNNFAEILFNLYALVFISRRAEGTDPQFAYITISSASVGAIKFGRLFLVCCGTTELQKGIGEFEICILQETLKDFKLDSEREVFYLKRQLHLMSKEFSIGRMYVPNSRFLFGVMATVATYIIVFYQLSVTPSYIKQSIQSNK